MNKITIQEPQGDEMPVLRNIWENVFGNVGMDAFFRHYFSPGLSVTAEFEGTPAAMGFLVPFGEIVNGSKPSPCFMIYSVGTLPEYRGKGLGTFVIRKLIARASDFNSPSVVLCPSEDGLFEYYSERTELRDYFYINELVFKTAPYSAKKTLPVEVSISEYKSLRENLLKDITFIRHDLRALEYQAELCKELGGGLYKIENSCAVIERQADGAIWVKELLMPGLTPGDLSSDAYMKDIIASIADKYPTDEYVVRFPSRTGEGRRFGMLTARHGDGSYTRQEDGSSAKQGDGSRQETGSSARQGEIKTDGPSPWYGVAFD